MSFGYIWKISVSIKQQYDIKSDFEKKINVCKVLIKMWLATIMQKNCCKGNMSNVFQYIPKHPKIYVSESMTGGACGVVLDPGLIQCLSCSSIHICSTYNINNTRILIKYKEELQKYS